MNKLIDNLLLRGIPTRTRDLALGVFWGAAMLAVFALWLGKFEPPQPSLADFVKEKVKNEAPPAVVSPPSGVVLGLLWAMSGVGLLAGVWFTVSANKLGMEPDAAAETRLRHLLGLILIPVGFVLALLGGYLVMTLGLAGFAESVGLCLFALIPLIGGVLLQQSAGSGDLVSFTLPHAERLARGLIGVGGIGMICFFWLWFGKKLNTPWLPELGAIVFESLMCITAALWIFTSQPGDRTPLAMRWLLMILGAGTGLILTLQSFFRTILWRQEVLFGGIPVWQSSNSWMFWMCAYTGLVGLVLIFGAMMLGRSEVRRQPVMRQALYGFNAVASGLLLLAFLGAFNVLVYATFPMSVDWSKAGFTSLSDASKNVLGQLQNKPAINVYVLLPQSGQGQQLFNDTRNLLDNCVAAAPANKFNVKYVSPDTDELLFSDLAQRFPEIQPENSFRSRLNKSAMSRGILLVQGALPPDPKTRVPYEFISDRKLMKDEFQDGRKRLYVGELEIMNSLTFLLRNKERHKIYILQGDGTLDINNSDQREGAGVLVDRLKKDNYDVQGISFGIRPKKEQRSETIYLAPSGPDKRKEIPEDAWALLIPGGNRRFDQPIMDALERYMERGGKLVVTLDMQFDEDKRMQKTGIETFLKRYGVDADKGFVIRRYYKGYPLPEIVDTFTPRDSKLDLARQFLRTDFRLVGARVVEPVSAGNFKAETLLQTGMVTDDQRLYLVETDIDSIFSPVQYFRRWTDRGPPPELENKIALEPVPVAVAVTEESKLTAARPRLVVFGNTGFIANDNLFFAKTNYYALLVGSLEWLGERPVLGIRPKESSIYMLPETAQFLRMVMTPLWLMTFGTLGLGTGVWLVRRR